MNANPCFKIPVFLSVSICIGGLFCPKLEADLIIGGSGNIVLVEEGGIFDAGNLALGGTPFTLDVIGGGIHSAHQTAHVNDGFIGNSNSWIGDSAGSFCGVSLGASATTVSSIAIGRDNTGAIPDRWAGLYTLRYTQIANPDETTAVTGDASTGWQDIGTMNYGAAVPASLYSSPFLRHRFNFDAVSATGIRIDTATNGTCIDELEIYATPGVVPPVVVIDPEAGFDITYDGNDGDHFNAAEVAIVPANLALSGTAFGSGELQPGGTHQIIRVNDGFYGNTNSWIPGAADPLPYIGIDLGGLTAIEAVAWGRDNGNLVEAACGGQCVGRNAGTYTIQITTDADPATSTNWTNIGSVSYSTSQDTAPGGGFTPWFRHQFGISTAIGDPLSATGLRILVPDVSICIDELEIFAAGSVPILTPVEEGGSADAGNLAASGTAFAKDTAAGRAVGSLNDETYGDASAWVGDTTNNFAGIALGSEMTVASVAFGRDNTGVLTDRTLGLYTLQYTTVASPDEATPDVDWTTIGDIDLTGVSPANPSLRHRFNFTAVMATGLRLLTPDGIAIDEFEIYATGYVPPPPPAIVLTPASGFDIGWDGNDGDHFDPDPVTAVPPDNLALAANGATSFASSDLGVELPSDNHRAPKLNDGLYGNVSSWIGADADPGPQAFAGIAFSEPTSIESIAWGRDNGNGAIDDSNPGTDDCGGQCDDRALGVYTLQFTTVPSPGAATPDGDWTTIGTVDYRLRRDALVGSDFTEFLRHEFSLAQGSSPILATGIRILVPATGIGGGTAIDEIEIYGSVSTAPFEITAFDLAPDGAATITFNSVPGLRYAIDASTNLQEGLGIEFWHELGDFPSQGSSTTVCVVPPGATSTCTPDFTLPGDPIPSQFFRAREFVD